MRSIPRRKRRADSEEIFRLEPEATYIEWRAGRMVKNTANPGLTWLV